MFLIVICTVLLSLSTVIDPKEPIQEKVAEILDSFGIENEVNQVLPAWIPVLFGVITPISFTANGILT